MDEQINPLAVTHLLQHTLRSLCTQESSQWVYAVFWRILPRNFPPPKWDFQEGAYDRSRGNRRNWILVWEDGFCNFAASVAEADSGDCTGSSAYNGNCEFQPFKGLQPELFFKMSHEIYNYGEGLIGKVAADRNHKWIYKDPSEQEINYLSAWHNTGDSFPRTWEAQFQSGIKTIALIAVREGVIQLGAVHKVMEDPNYIVLLRKKFCYLESIPGVLLPHPSSSLPIPYGAPNTWPYLSTHPTSMEIYHNNHDHFMTNTPLLKITPSMSALQALLSKLPSVVPTQSPSSSGGYCDQSGQFVSSQRPLDHHQLGEIPKSEKEEIDEEYRRGRDQAGESSNSISYQQQQEQHGHFNLSNGRLSYKGL